MAESMLEVRTNLEDTLAEASNRRPLLLVCGPPKSGKSTLLVAMAGKHVLKVSDQPSLPAPVCVLQSPGWSLTIVRNDGTKDSYLEPARARIEIQGAHRNWIDGMRRAQAESLVFDPKSHAPRSALRIDLLTPAPGLEKSGIALAEMPHLPLDLPVARERILGPLEAEAASTVIVLRTEDLQRPELLRVYEPTIAEGHSVYLVLNLDRGKTDLGTKGNRISTADLTDPVRVIEDFQSLAAPQSWLDAFGEGRLRVHLLPLLDIAASRTGGGSPSPRSGRAHLVPRPRSSQIARDDLMALEAELNQSVHEGLHWRSHVDTTLRSIDRSLDELKAVFDEVCAGPKPAPQSLEPGVLGLGSVHTALRAIREQHLAQP